LSKYDHLDFVSIPRGKEYEPALTVQSVSSDGQSARILGIKTGRQHDLLSLNEQCYFFISEFSDLVEDIREQFPMNIDKTLLIANELGIEHPNKNRDKECMTSDFCLTIKNGNTKYDIIRTIKPLGELLDRRTIEKFEIERVYWARENIDWGIVTDIEINKILAKNIRTFRASYSITEIPGLMELSYRELCFYKRELAIRLEFAETTTRSAIHEFSANFHLSEGACIALFNHLIATKVLRMNMLDDFNIDRINPMSINHSIMDELLKAE